MLSMTGFGRSEIEIDGRTISVEIKSINHRYLDINPRMPRFLSFLDADLRKTVKSRLNRGRVDIFINYQTMRDDAKTVDINFPIIKGYIDAAKDISDNLDVTNDIAISKLMSMPESIKITDKKEDEQAISNLLNSALQQALDGVISSREKEGNILKQDISKRLKTLLDLTEKIESKEDTVVLEYKQKLSARLSELLDQTEIDQTRFNTEVAYFADRCNITEELVRLKSHLNGFTADIEKDGPCGRQFDFLVQEINREFNTIGSKSSDVEITNSVLAAKGELEKIREQIQNIE